MTTGVAPFPVFRVLKADGSPLAFGWVHTYAAGTSVPLATYTDYSGNTPNTNPTQLDANGQANIRFASTAYKIEVRDSTDTVVEPGWPQDYVYGSDKSIADLSATLAATAGAGLIGYGPSTAYARGTVGNALNTTVLLEALIPASFTTSTTDCSPYILTAFGLGNTIEFKRDTDYFVGNLTSSQIVFDLTVTRCKIIGNNARIVCNTADGTTPSIFRFKNPNGITIQDLRLIDNASGAYTVTPRGAALFDFADDAPATDNRGITLINCEAQNAGALFRVRSISGSTYKTKDIHLINCRAINCWYGARMSASGENITGNMLIDGCVIGWLAEDVNTSDVRLDCANPDAYGTTVFSPNDRAYVLISRTSNNGIVAGHRLKLFFKGTVTAPGNVPLAGLRHDDTGSEYGTIRDIDFDFDVHGITGVTAVLLNFWAVSSGVIAATTNSKYDEIRINGSPYTSTGATIQALKFRTVAATTGTNQKFYMAPTFGRVLQQFGVAAGTDLHVIFKTSPFEEVHYQYCTPNNTGLTIDVPNDPDGTINFFLWLESIVFNDWKSGAAVNSSYKEFKVIGYSTAGTCVLQTAVTATYTLDQGTAVTTQPLAGSVSAPQITLGPTTGAPYAANTGLIVCRVKRLNTTL